MELITDGAFPALAAALAREGFRVTVGPRVAGSVLRPVSARKGRVRITIAPGQQPAMWIAP